MRALWPTFLVTWLVVLAGPAAAGAVELELVGDFTQPIYATSDPGDPDRLFVVERAGEVLEVAGGSSSTYADLRDVVSCCTSERGLLSIALAPDFAETERIYAIYTGNTSAGGAEGDLHVDAVRPDGSGGMARERILSIGHADFANHNGGQLQFGPDGYLYISTGDGGGGGDPQGNGQSLDTLLGKILRIEPRPGESPAYAIPPGNPFAGPGEEHLRDEIWAWGLRNPWRFSFDRMSGDMVIGDVGQNAREEVDFAPSPQPGRVGGAGNNYGWNCREGLIAYSGAPAECADAGGFTDPVFDYAHDTGRGVCSITGGYVVRDRSLGDLYGRYVYADFCEGELRSLQLPSAGSHAATDDRAEGVSVSQPITFGEDSCGRIYVGLNGGELYRLVGSEPADCSHVGGDDPEPEPPEEPEDGGAGSDDPSDPGDEEEMDGSGDDAGPGPAVRSRVLLRAGARFVRRGQRVRIAVRVAPCQGSAGRRVLLNRRGPGFAVRRLNHRCRAVFAPRIRRPSIFRALIRAPGSNRIIPSHPVLVLPVPLVLRRS